MADDAARDVPLSQDSVAAGDLEAFGRAFASHEKDVGHVCRRLLGSAEEAKDAPHEVFLRARRSFHTYDASRPLRPWLLAIAGNYCIDVLRQRSVEQRVFSEEDPELAAGDPTEELAGASPLGRLVALEEREAVGRAIAELPLKYRLPIALRYFNDLDYETIADTLGISRGQVGTLLFRAKRQLREALTSTRKPRGRR